MIKKSRSIYIDGQIVSLSSKFTLFPIKTFIALSLAVFSSQHAQKVTRKRVWGCLGVIQQKSVEGETIVILVLPVVKNVSCHAHTHSYTVSLWSFSEGNKLFLTPNHIFVSDKGSSTFFGVEMHISPLWWFKVVLSSWLRFGSWQISCRTACQCCRVTC